MTRVEKLYNKNIDASGLALFRIAYSAVLLGEVMQLFYFRHLVYDKIPFIEPSEINPTYGLLVWMGAIIFLMFGLFTRQAAILNYVLSLIFIGTISTYEYHMFYVYRSINFLLMFVNTWQVGSLDTLRVALTHSTSRSHLNARRTVSVLNYYIIVLVSLGFVYLDSFFYKALSHNWMTGLGMWLPASLVYMSYTDMSPLLNIKWFALALGYLTLAFEAVFIFLFFRKGWRVILLVIGVGLHIGITITFPIPWFGLGATATYLLLVPVCFWRQIRARLSFKKPSLTVFYDEESTFCNKIVIILKHFDYLKAIAFTSVQAQSASFPALTSPSKHQLPDRIYSITHKNAVKSGISMYAYAFNRMPLLFFVGWLISLPGTQHLATTLYDALAANHSSISRNDETRVDPKPVGPFDSDRVMGFRSIRYKDIKLALIVLGIAALIALQINASYNAPLISLILTKIGFSETSLDRRIKSLSRSVRHQSEVLLGITNHPVFMDSHFTGHNHVIALEAVDRDGKREWLPIVNKYGGPDFYNSGFTFVKWTFRVNSVNVIQDTLGRGIRDFSTFWAIQNGRSLNEIQFNVYVKRVDVPVTWAKDVLTKQKSVPWRRCGEAYWNNGAFVADICDIESQ